MRKRCSFALNFLRRIHKKKIANQIFIYEKSSANVSKIKRLKLPGIIIKNLDQAIKKSDLIILSTPMSEYKNLILKMNKFLSPKKVITDIGSSKQESLKIIKKFLRKDIFWTSSHPLATSLSAQASHRWCKERVLMLQCWAPSKSQAAPYPEPP